MQYVDLESKPSAVHGTGCYAKAAIPAGALISTWFDNVKVVSEKSHLKQWELNGRSATGVRFLGPLFLVARQEGELEPSEYINHSATPNVGYFFGILVARRPIKTGEELFLDYHQLNSAREEDVVWGFGPVKTFAHSLGEVLRCGLNLLLR